MEKTGDEKGLGRIGLWAAWDGLGRCFRACQKEVKYPG